MAVDRVFEDLCRICVAGGSEGTVSIYSAEGKSRRLSDKIAQFLSLEISEEDNLPKVVCKDCQNKLDSIEHFRDLASKSQKTLTKMANSKDSPLDGSSSGETLEGPSLMKEESNWWSFPESGYEAKFEDDDEPSSEAEPTSDSANDSSKGLLHSILTKGQTFQSNDVTEMEVTVDPMLFFEEEEEEQEDEVEGHQEEITESTNNSGPIVNVEAISGSESMQRVSEPKPYQCYLCPRGFNSDLSLKSHLWNHLPSRKVLATSDLNRFEMESSLRTRVFNSHCLCQDCGRVYPSKSTLRAHQITHSNLRPHKCSLCDKTFKRNQDLKFHINQHTGERPYRCPYCPKAFASSGNCFSHRKRMHPKQLARDKKRNRR